MTDTAQVDQAADHSLVDADYRAFALYLDGGPASVLDNVSPAARRLATTILPPEESVEGWEADAALIMACENLFPAGVGERIYAEIVRRDPTKPPPPDDRESFFAQTMTLSKLLTQIYPEPKWLVPNLLPIGLGYCSGKPKSGKSWLSLQLVQAIGHGGVVLGERVPQRRAVYAALEDPYHRLQARLRDQMSEPSDNVLFTTEMPPLGAGALEWCQKARAYFNAELIILDTLSRLMPGNKDQNSSDDMTALLGPLQRWAVEENICVLIIDHKRKGGGDGEDDHWNSNFGATGKIAVADFNWSLSRKRLSKKADLYMGGRDLKAEWKQPLRWDGATCTWQTNGERVEAESESEQTEQDDDLMSQVAALGGQVTREQLSQVTGLSQSTLFRRLASLESAGLMSRRKEGKRVVWEVSPDAADELDDLDAA